MRPPERDTIRGHIISDDIAEARTIRGHSEDTPDRIAARERQRNQRPYEPHVPAGGLSRREQLQALAVILLAVVVVLVKVV